MPPEVATRPVPKLLWTILFSVNHIEAFYVNGSLLCGMRSHKRPVCLCSVDYLVF